MFTVSSITWLPWLRFLKLIAEGVFVSMIHQGEPEMCQIMRYQGMDIVRSSGYIYPSYEAARRQADHDQPHFPGTDTFILCIPARELV